MIGVRKKLKKEKKRRSYGKRQKKKKKHRKKLTLTIMTSRGRKKNIHWFLPITFTEPSQPFPVEIKPPSVFCFFFLFFFSLSWRIYRIWLAFAMSPTSYWRLGFAVMILHALLNRTAVVCGRQSTEEAYVTLLYGDEFLLGVRVLGKSIRDTGSTKDMVALVSDGVSDFAKKLLQVLLVVSSPSVFVFHVPAYVEII